MIKRALSPITVFLLTLLVSGAAWACPQCAGREEFTWSAWLILASFVVFPFVVVGVTWPLVKRLIATQEVTENPSGENIG
jgi:hypothetical protein